MRFNKSNVAQPQSSSSSMTNSRSSNREQDDGIKEPRDLVAIDTLKIDKNFRITLTKKFQNILDIKEGDTIAVYKEHNTNDLVFKFQRGRHGTVIDSWYIKRAFKNIFSKINLDTQVQNLDPQVKQYVTNNMIKNEANSRLLNSDINSANSSKKIMIIDDDKDMLLTFKTYLTFEGYYIETFSNAEEALKRFSKIQNFSFFDLLIIDIRMPGINGLQLYHLLKAMNSDLKILFISALDAVQEIVSMLPNIDANSIIIRKPVDKDEFVKKVHEVIINTY